MGNKIPNNIDFKKEFSKEFDRLARVHEGHEVWKDFITMSACSLSNVFDKHFEKEREELYRKCASHYTKEELNVFGELLFYVIMSFSANPKQDFLGTLFMENKLSNKSRGQRFTPYGVCELTAGIVLSEQLSEKKTDEPITICDSSCGGGAMLIAAANLARRSGKLNPQKDIVFYAQDIDPTVALMCYIQLSVLGLKAIVKIGDTLSDPMVEGDMEKECVWITPMLAGEAFFDMHRSLMNLIGKPQDTGKDTDAA